MLRLPHALTSPCVYVVMCLSASGTADVFVVKLSTSGTVQWAKGFGGTSNDYGQGIAVEASGSYVYIGTHVP
jgi:hypothetical protein